MTSGERLEDEFEQAIDYGSPARREGELELLACIAIARVFKLEAELREIRSSSRRRFRHDLADDLAKGAEMRVRAELRPRSGMVDNVVPMLDRKRRTT